MGVPLHAVRRPLKSKTYNTFTRLLSLSNHPTFNSHLQDDNKSWKAQELCSAEARNKLVDLVSVPDDRKEGESSNMQLSLDLIARTPDEEGNLGFGDIIELVVDQGNASDPVSESMHKPHDAHCMLEAQSSSFSPVRELKANEESSVKDVCEAIDRSLHVVAAAESSKLLETGEQVAAVDDQNISFEMEKELQRREVELEKLIMSSNFVDPPPFESAYGDIEEGELSADMEDMLSQYDTLPTAEKPENLQTFKYSSDGKEFAREVEQSEIEKNKDDDAPNNKKKRGPISKERREKKKKRKRIKRAEKNKTSGKTRMKIQPMVKPKEVSYCRHYLRGRCQEGEKCKFSHDIVPLTKSTPCGHFARQSCMKGDDCPYDHQLSKYPCNNYASKGFCSRGVDCLFSHEIPPKETRPVVSYVDACELKTPSASSSLNPPTSQKVVAKSCPTVKTQSIQPPKGVNILVHGQRSAVSMGKQLDSQLSKADSGEKAVQSVTQNHKKVNEVVDMAAARTPRGINFLSFGKSPMNGSNGKVVSILPPDRDPRNRNSALVTPTPNGDDATKSDSQCRLFTSPPSVPRGINFVSIGKSSNNYTPGGPSNPQHSEDKSASTSIPDGKCASKRSQIPMPCKSASAFTFNSAVDREAGLASSSKSPFLSETSSMMQKALHSTLSFAANVEPLMKLNSSKTPFGNKISGSLQSNQANASTVLDYLNGSMFKPKT